MPLPRQHLISRIKDLDFYFWDLQMYTDLWRQERTTLMTAIPRHDYWDEVYVLTSLKIAGCDEEEFKKLINST